MKIYNWHSFIAARHDPFGVAASPDLVHGTTAPDGDAIPFKNWPIGTHWITTLAGSVETWLKIADNNVDADWARMIVSSAVQTVTADDTVLVAEQTTLVNPDSGAVDVTLGLPTAVGLNGKLLRIKNIGQAGYSVVVDGDGTETIDRDLTFTLIDAEAITIVSDNANWWIV